MTSAPKKLQEQSTWLTPISAQAPCGPDLGRDPAFFLLRSLATAGGGLDLQSCDWGEVYDLGQKLLLTKTKDLRIASYVAVASMHREGTTGLAWGLELIVSLLETFPDALHPKLKRERVLGRDRAIEWYLEQLRVWVRQNPKHSLTNEQHERAAGLCDRLARMPPQVLAHADQIAATLLRELPKTALRDARSEHQAAKGSDVLDKQSEALQPASTKRSKDKQEQDARTGRSEPDDLAVEPRHASPDAQRDASIEKKSNPDKPSPRTVELGNISALQRRLAAQLRSQDPLHPLSFRLLRQALWTPLFHLAIIHTGSIKLPTQAQRRSLNAHLESQRWAGLLEQSEDIFTQCPLCLDLQRYSSMALRMLGKNPEALASIDVELDALLHRHPRLLHSSGVNDLPLADAATRAWLRERGEVSPIAPQTTLNKEEPDDWWAQAKIDGSLEAQELLSRIQGALDLAPDRRSFAQRSLKIAKQALPIPGLSLLLLRLAVDTLAAPDEVCFDRELEQACMSELLQARQAQSLRPSPVQQCQETKRLALALGRRNLSAALPYFTSA